MGISLSADEINTRARLFLTPEPFQITEGITVTGRIPRHSNFELPVEKMVTRRGDKLVIDEFYDDRSMVLETQRGLVVLLGCCHAGLINTLMYVKEHFSLPIHAIIGGTHLIEASPERIEKTITQLQEEYKPDVFYLNHCTGLKALVALSKVFGEKVHTFGAGGTLEF